MKASPEDLRDLADDLDALKNDYRDVINAEPILKQPLEDAAKYARKRYEDVSEKR